LGAFRSVRRASRNEANHLVFFLVGVADDQHPQPGTQAEKYQPVFVFRVIRVSYQETMLVGKRGLRFLKGYFVVSLVRPVLFRIPIEAQFRHCRGVYR
jgi:hypothetical protein